MYITISITRSNHKTAVYVGRYVAERRVIISDKAPDTNSASQVVEI